MRSIVQCVVLAVFSKRLYKIRTGLYKYRLTSYDMTRGKKFGFVAAIYKHFAELYMIM